MGGAASTTASLPPRHFAHSAHAPYSAKGASKAIATAARISNPMHQPK